MKSEGWRVNDKVQMCQKYLRDQRLDDGHNVTAANILDESGANGALREAYDRKRRIMDSDDRWNKVSRNEEVPSIGCRTSIKANTCAITMNRELRS